LSLNTALNHELRQLKQQETTLLKLLLDHLASCPAPDAALAALSEAPETDSHGGGVPCGSDVLTAAAGSVQM